MVPRRIESFGRLSKELNEVGQFAKVLPTSGVSREVKSALDFLYSELKDMEIRNQFPVHGRFFEVTFDDLRVHINSFRKAGSIHVKSLPMSHNDMEVFRILLTMIPSFYSTIAVLPEHSYITEKRYDFSYFVEYNISQEKEHIP